MPRLIVLLCLGVAGLVAGSGCSVPSTSKSSATSESISVSEQTRNGVCMATVGVQESANGQTHTLHQAGVPCAGIKAVQVKLVSEAKQGL